jgi:hypothetical protein
LVARDLKVVRSHVRGVFIWRLISFAFPGTVIFGEE